jgi:hypothetical protein
MKLVRRIEQPAGVTIVFLGEHVACDSDLSF